MNALQFVFFVVAPFFLLTLLLANFLPQKRRVSYLRISTAFIVVAGLAFLLFSSAGAQTMVEEGIVAMNNVEKFLFWAAAFGPLLFVAASILSFARPRRRRISFISGGMALALFLVGLLTLPGCAAPHGYGPEQFFRNVGSRVVSGLPKFDFPVARQLGITPNGQNIVIVNGTVFYGRVFVYEKEVGALAPGDELFAPKYFEPLSPQIPIAVMFYREYDGGKEFKQYVGVAGRIFQFSVGHSSDLTWSIQGREIQTPEGTYSSATLGINYPPPKTTRTGRKIEIPREAWNGTTGVQVVNNTTYVATVGIGPRRFSLLPGEGRYVVLKTLMGPGQSVSLRATFTDNDDRAYGTYQESIWASGNGVLARQIFISPHMIRR